MKNYIWAGIILLNCFCWNIGASVNIQSPTFITTNDGLSNNSIRYLFQDSKGFVWVSTVNGLNRYDGYSFVTFQPQKKDKISLSDYHIRKVSEDSNGFLWISTSSNIYSCYDLKHGCFVDYTGCGEYKQNYTNYVETTNGGSWLWHSQNGCRKVIYKDGAFSSVVFCKSNGKLPSDQVNGVTEDWQGNTWIYTKAGLAKITGNDCEVIDRTQDFVAAMPYKSKCFFLTKKGEIYVYESGKRLRSLQLFINGTMSSHFCVENFWVIFSEKGGNVFSLPESKMVRDERFNIPNGKYFYDNKGDIYIHNGTGILHYLQAKEGKMKSFQLISTDKISPVIGEEYDVVQDERGLLWITVFGNGLFVYNPDTDEMDHYTYQEEGRNFIATNFLRRIIIDRSGSIWIGSEYSGITRLSVLNDGASFTYPEDKNLTDHSNAIRMLAPLSDGDIWVGTRKGSVYVYDAPWGSNKPRMLPYSHICAVTKDSKGKLWLGSRGKGVNIDGHWYTHDVRDPYSLANNDIFNIFRDCEDRMWIATFGGGLDLAALQGGKYIFYHFLTALDKQREVRVVTQDSRGYIWVGTNNGLYVFHPNAIMIDPENYDVYNYSNSEFSSNEVKCIFRDSQDRMWIGMLDGFYICTPESDHKKLKFDHYSISNGLINNMVETIIEDKYGKFWVATEYGISRFDLGTKIFENFFFSATMQGNVYNENSACLTKDGLLLFGTNHGIIIIDPQKVNLYATKPNVVLTQLKVNGLSVHPDDKDSPINCALGYTDFIELNHNQNSFIIEFSTFDYSIASSTKYTYKLDHFDADWSVPSPLNFAGYKNLEPGVYSLRIKACNEAGVWSKNETVLKIVITPPFWKTVWAYMIYLILAGMILYLIFRVIRNFNGLRNRIQIEKQLTEYKLIFFTNISHEFRTPLTLIRGALEKIERMDNLPQEINYPFQLMTKSTNRMLLLINQLLEFRKLQNNKLSLNVEETDVVKFFHEISLNFEDTANDKDIKFHFVHDNPSYSLFIDQSKLDKIVYNLLSNAFKYTPRGGEVTFHLSVNEEAKQFIFSVSDTGVGIPKEKQGELFSRFIQNGFSNDSIGIGLHLTYELVNLHKGEISYCENKGGGSVFTVILPLNSNAYEEKDFRIPGSVVEETSSHHTTEIVRSVEEKAQAAPLNKKKVLIIEDDTDVRNLLKAELGPYFEIITESDGVSGLDRAQILDIDLIICDVLMPGMNGFEVTRTLRSSFDTSHIPIVLLTAMGTPENQLTGVESGADIYITKPFSLKLLLARVFQLIEQREKLYIKFSNDPTVMTPTLCSTEIDRKFLERLQTIMEHRLSDPDFTIDNFAAMLGLRRTSFFRKVKGLTGYTPNEYIRIVRMKKAAELLQDGRYNISEISYMVGMKDPLYFSRCFKDQFGAPPSTYIKENKK